MKTPRPLRPIVWSILLITVCIAGATVGAKAGDGCEALHDTYTAVGADGGSYATWHPPSVTLPDGTVCHFGHEHGSDPSLFPGAAEARPVAFGWVDRLAGHDEPHVGFKVFVVPDDGHGLAYRIVLHQGTGHGQRALIQFHEVQFAVADARTGALLADTVALANFGPGQANCLPHSPLQTLPATSHQSTGAAGAAAAQAPPNRSVPTVDCAAETPYETWRMAYAIARPSSSLPTANGQTAENAQPVFSSSLTFEIDDPSTVFDPADPERLVYLCAVRPSRQCDDPAGTQTAWKGTRRGLVAPLLAIANGSGPERFSTDPYGAPGDGVLQFVSLAAQLDASAECCGPGVVFKERDGRYVRQSDDGPAFSTGADDGSVHWPN
ncbi:MAG: hypothetical protein U0893_15455 [Chloroflexota bacterium]